MTSWAASSDFSKTEAADQADAPMRLASFVFANKLGFMGSGRGVSQPP